MSFLLILFFNCLIFNSLIQGAENEDLPDCSDIHPCCTCLDKVANEKVEIDQEKLKNLEEECKKKILGQDEIVEKVCEIVKIAFLVGGEKPYVILLGGEQGCGKTSLVETIAQHIYGDKYKNFYEKIDMQCYNGEQYVSTLVGSAKGYIGDDGVIAKICKQKKKIILFDEIEKTHKSVYTTLLSFLENGEIMTGKGTKCSLPKDCVIFMTTNAGSAFLDKIDDFNIRYCQNAKNNEDILKRSLQLGLDSNGNQRNEHGMVKELIDRIQHFFVMKTVKDQETIKIFIKNCIEDTVKELNNRNHNISLIRDENMVIDDFFEKHITKESSMRTIKNTTSEAIKGAFTQFILTKTNINLKEYSSPRKEIKLTWANDKFECLEAEPNN